MMHADVIDLDQIAELANQTFILYKLGPIFEFHKTSNTIKEKTFVAQLCQSLRLHDGRKTRRSANKNKANHEFDGDLLKLDIDTINLEDLKTYDPEIKPLRFTIEFLLYRNDRLTVHSFYMIPSPTVPAQEKNPGVFAYYPLVLMKATNQIRQEIITWFDKRFVATCTPLFMYPATMVDAVEIWIDSIHDLKEKLKYHLNVPDLMLKPPLILEYETGDQDMPKVILKVSRQQVLDICECLSDRRQFLSTFQKHVENTVHFKLDTLTLYQVSSAIANIRRDGHVKISPHAYKAFAVGLIQSWVNLSVEKLYKI